MTRVKRWTTEEDDTLVQFIRTNPDDLKFALQETAKVLNRSYLACKARYARITNPKEKCYKGNCLMAITKISKKPQNVVYDLPHDLTSRLPIWKRIAKFIVNLFNKL